MRKFFWFIMVSGIVLAIAGYFYWQKNPFSRDIITLEIIGPSETELAKEIEYTVKYKNTGEIRLEEAKLIFEFPDNSLLEEGQKKNQEIGPEKLGDIYPGEERTFSFKTRLLGKEGDLKLARAYLSYKPKNLSARYESSTSLATVIKNIPINFDFDIPNKTQSGQDFNFSVNYFSRLEQSLDNMEIKIEYPSDFDFIKSEPKGLGQTEWDLPVLEKGEGGRIEIGGRLKGSYKEQKIFKAVLGIWLGNDFVVLEEAETAVEISKTDIYVSQKINGKEKYTASPGEALHYEISFKNTENSSFSNISLTVLLDSPAFDFDNIKVASGKFNKSDNSIVFDYNAIPKLRFLSPGESGKVEFWINLKEQWQVDLSRERNFIAKNIILISDTSQAFETKINTKLDMEQKVFFNDDVFGNQGPFPVETGKKTTFTIIWQAKNYYNSVKNVKIKAILPSNVSLTDKVFPEYENSNLTFDSQSREIVWAIGDMLPGKGVINEGPDIAFQVSLDSKSTADILLNQVKITGEDQFTEQKIEKIAFPIIVNLITN